MRIVFFGTPDFALPSLRSMRQAGHEIVSVVSQPDRPRRRQSSTPEPSPVKAEAQRAGLPVLTPESTKDPGFFETLLRLAPEVMVVVAYGRILPPEILRIPPRWCINLHASLLPKYRGAAPIARAIMAGAKATRGTPSKIGQGRDTGDLPLQPPRAPGPRATAGALARPRPRPRAAPPPPVRPRRHGLDHRPMPGRQPSANPAGPVSRPKDHDGARGGQRAIDPCG